MKIDLLTPISLRISSATSAWRNLDLFSRARISNSWSINGGNSLLSIARVSLPSTLRISSSWLQYFCRKYSFLIYDIKSFFLNSRFLQFQTQVWKFPNNFFLALCIFPYLYFIYQLYYLWNSCWALWVWERFFSFITSKKRSHQVLKWELREFPATNERINFSS